MDKKPSEMSHIELRFACAKKAGWVQCLDNDVYIFPTDVPPYIDSVLYQKGNTKRYGLPDYTHDLNHCMELMETIWSIEPMALLEYRKCLGYVIEWDFDTDDDRYRKYASGETLQIAIMKAFLEVME